MSTISLRPGQFIYCNGQGLSVVVGRKKLDIASMLGSNAGNPEYKTEGSHTWELRPIYNPHAPINLVEKESMAERVRQPLTKEQIEPVLHTLTQPLTPEEQQNKPKEKTLTSMFSSLDPQKIADALRYMTAKHKGTTNTLKGVSGTDKDYILKAVHLLADDLSMAAGLTATAARQHILELALATKAQNNVWPLQAGNPKALQINDEQFQEIFGISIDQADDLQAYPPTIEKKDPNSDGRKKDKFTVQLINALNSEASTSISNPLKRYLSKHPETLDLYRQLAMLSQTRGLPKAALDMAVTTLTPDELFVLGFHNLVKPENRLTISDIAAQKDLSEEEVQVIFESAKTKALAQARAQEASLMVSYIEGSSAGKKLTPTPKKENQSLYDELDPFVAPKGLKRGAFYLSAATMNNLSFHLLAKHFLVGDDHKSTLEELAVENNLSIEQTADNLKTAIRNFSTIAINHSKNGYLTKDMAELCPDIAGLIVPRSKRKSAPAQTLPAGNPETLRLAEQEKDNIPGGGMLLKLFKLTARILPPELFHLYVSTDLRNKATRITIEQAARDRDIPVEQAIEMRDKAISLAKAELLKTGKEPEITYSALELSTAGKDKDTATTAQQASSTPKAGHADAHEPLAQAPFNGAAAGAGDPMTEDFAASEDTIYEYIKTQGFDYTSLRALGHIHEKKGDFERAIGFYGAARDLVDGNSSLEAHLEILQHKHNITYGETITYSQIEEYIQQKLNEGEDFDAIYNPVDNEDQGPDEPAVSQPTPASQAVPAPSYPQITYAIPAEALVPGQRLRMTFNPKSNGEVEVTMEVELTEPRHKEAPQLTEKPPETAHSSNGLTAEFSTAPDGRATLSVAHEGQPIGEKRAYKLQ